MTETIPEKATPKKSGQKNTLLNYFQNTAKACISSPLKSANVEENKENKSGNENLDSELQKSSATGKTAKIKTQALLSFPTPKADHKIISLTEGEEPSLKSQDREEQNQLQRSASIRNLPTLTHIEFARKCDGSIAIGHHQFFTLCMICDFVRSFGRSILRLPLSMIKGFHPEQLREWLCVYSLNSIVCQCNDFHRDHSSPEFCLLKLVSSLVTLSNPQLPLLDEIQIHDAQSMLNELSSIASLETGDTFFNNLMIIESLLDKALVSVEVNSYMSESLKDKIKQLQDEKKILQERVHKIQLEMESLELGVASLDNDIERKEASIKLLKMVISKRVSGRNQGIEGEEEEEEEESKSRLRSRLRSTTARREGLAIKRENESRLSEAYDEWRNLLKNHDKKTTLLHHNEKVLATLEETLVYVEGQLKELLTKKAIKGGHPSFDLNSRVAVLLGCDRFGRAYWFMNFNNICGVLTEHSTSLQIPATFSEDTGLLDSKYDQNSDEIKSPTSFTFTLDKAPSTPYFQAITNLTQLTELLQSLCPSSLREKDLLRSLRQVKLSIEPYITSRENQQDINFGSYLQKTWGIQLEIPQST